MKLDYVAVEKHGPVAIVRFDRRENLNAFNQKLVRELTAVARSFHDDLQTHAVVLTGASNGFSAGADLRDPETWNIEALSDLERRHTFYGGVRLCHAWEEMPQLTICAMERLSVGAGVAIALACDWRVLGRGAYLYVPETKIGLNLQWGALPRLVTLVGPAKAKRITLMQEKMGAQQALDWGLVDAVAEDGQTVDKALEMAHCVLDQAPAVTVRLVKEAINATASALHRASSFADADQSQLTGKFEAAVEARRKFRKP
ncbi:MAG: crt [Alphaproteobacteria bacterium]|jgi:enoyl-CoA hydratase/carnithine racemase|nr:crt [Alphaproteobacteria bacterium]